MIKLPFKNTFEKEKSDLEFKSLYNVELNVSWGKSVKNQDEIILVLLEFIDNAVRLMKKKRTILS